MSAANNTDWVVLVCCRVVVLIALLLLLALRLLRSRAYAPPLAWADRSATDGTKPVAFAVVSIDADIRCLRRKSSVARACVPSTRSNGEGRARSADWAPVCCWSPGLDADGEVSAGVDTAGDDLESSLLDRGALLACSVGAVRGDRLEIADSIRLFTLP